MGHKGNERELTDESVKGKEFMDKESPQLLSGLCTFLAELLKHSGGSQNFSVSLLTWDLALELQKHCCWLEWTTWLSAQKFLRSSVNSTQCKGTMMV